MLVLKLIHVDIDDVDPSTIGNTRPLAGSVQGYVWVKTDMIRILTKSWKLHIFKKSKYKDGKLND